DRQLSAVHGAAVAASGRTARCQPAPGGDGPGRHALANLLARQLAADPTRDVGGMCPRFHPRHGRVPGGALHRRGKGQPARDRGGAPVRGRTRLAARSGNLLVAARSYSRAGHSGRVRARPGGGPDMTKTRPPGGIALRWLGRIVLIGVLIALYAPVVMV